MNEAEHRGAGPDPKSEREHGHGGEAGILQQLTKSEFEIIHISDFQLPIAGQSKHQIPNTKLQRHSKLQIPNGAAIPPYWSLRFEIWSFSGVWSLVFGVFIRVLGSWFLVFLFIPLDNDEIRMTKPEIRTKRLSLVTFGLWISNLGFHALFGIRISDLIRHSSFTSERFHRIDTHGAARGKPAGDQSNARHGQ
jgi:hypothetical protein